MTYQDKCYVLCIEYVSQTGVKVIGRSPPTTRKAAYRKKRECEALKKGERAWVEKKEFTLVNPTYTAVNSPSPNAPISLATCLQSLTSL